MQQSLSQSDEQRTEMIRNAFMMYVEMGLPVIPLCPPDHRKMSYSHRQECTCPGKAPIIENWTAHVKTEYSDVQSWLSKNPYVNIGLPMGNASGIIGIDVDGEMGEKLLVAISGGVLPETWEYTTGNGRRLLYALPAGVKTRKFTNRKAKHEELAILCDGQQTVLPPSIHATGKMYTWVEGKSPYDIVIQIAPEWIISSITSKDSESSQRSESHVPINVLPNSQDTRSTGRNNRAYDEPEKIKTGQFESTVTADDWQKTVGQGQRNTHLAKLAGSLISRRNIPRDQIILFLNTWNQEHCQPPLPEIEIQKMVDSLYATEAMKHAKRKKSKDDKPVFRPTPFALNFINLQKELGYSWKYSTDYGSFYRCDDSTGPWQRQDIVLVQKAVREALLDPGCGGGDHWDSSHFVNEGVNALKERLASPGDIGLFDIGYNSALYSELICLENGVLYWDSGELKPWSSNLYTTIQLPVKYDEHARCDTFIKSLEEWVPDPTTRLFLQEFVGLSLIPDTSFRTAVFLYGSGANGKSLFLEAVRMLFGDALVSIPLHRLQDRFETANLQNKLINICGDIDAKYLSETGVLKALISGDTMRGEFKHGKSFDFVPVARLMFSANSLPKVSDKSHAWYSRWKFIHFPNTFPIDAAYKNRLLKQFEKEKSGLLNWAIEGLIRLKRTNVFSYSKTMQLSAEQYRSENDTVVAFIKDVIQKVEHVGAETMLSTAALHHMYKEWCETFGVQSVSQIEFVKRAQASGLEKDRRSIKGKTCAVFLGAQVTDEWKQTYKFYESIRPSRV